MKLFALVIPAVVQSQSFGGFSASNFFSDDDVTETDISENSEDFDGFFENFDFDGILKQSDSPLAQQLLAVDNIYNDEGEVVLGQKGWFDSDQVREERRIKKLKQIMKMVFFLQADASPSSLEKYLYYGCYCFPDGDQKLFSGFGDPIDEVDKVCRRFQTCYRCVGVDYGQEECINTSGYKFSGVVDPVTGKKDIICKNKKENCGAAQCQCDRQLAFQLAEAEITWNPNHQGNKYGMFDRQSQCNIQQRSATVNHDIDTKCCGYYPERTPYAANGPNGIRNCCGSKTYDPRILECCPGNILQSLGTCIF